MGHFLMNIRFVPGGIPRRKWCAAGRRRCQPETFRAAGTELFSARLASITATV